MTLDAIKLQEIKKSRKAQSLFKKYKLNLKEYPVDIDYSQFQEFYDEFSIMEVSICRRILIDDYKRNVARGFLRKDKVNIGQGHYQLNSKFTIRDVQKYFGSYEKFRRAAILGISPDDEVHHRGTIEAKLNEKSKPGVYFVAAAIAGQSLNLEFFDVILNFCKINKAKLIILPMRGVHKGDELYPPELSDYMSSFYTEVKFNSNLTAVDMLLYPQQQLPLTGFERYGHKGKSLILASPKQQLKFIPVSNVGLPHIAHSTGAITNPDNYAKTRAGAMATQDHIMGGLIVEVKDSKIFHIRQVQADVNGEFSDLEFHYSKNKQEKAEVSALIVPDYHVPFYDESAIQAWLQLSSEILPEHIIFHDLIDGYSISHHHEDDIYTQVNRPAKVATLELELSAVAKELSRWQNHTKAKLIVVKSNHDEVIEKWIKRNKWVSDRFNYNVGRLLAGYYVTEQKDPLEHYLRDVHDIQNIKFLKREEEFKLEGVHLGYHGDKGPNGTKASAKSLAHSLGNCIVGHIHSPSITHGAFVVGTSSMLHRDYNVGSPSSWFHTACILYKGGQRQLISAVKGKYK